MSNDCNARSQTRLVFVIKYWSCHNVFMYNSQISKSFEMFAMHLSKTKFILLNSFEFNSIDWLFDSFNSFNLHRKYFNHKFLDFGFALTARSWIVRSFEKDEEFDDKNWMYLSQTSSTYGFWSIFSSNIRSWSVISKSSLWFAFPMFTTCCCWCATEAVLQQQQQKKKKKRKLCGFWRKKKVRDPQEQKTFYARKKQGGARRSFVFSFKKLGTGYYTHGLCNSHSERKRGARPAGNAIDRPRSLWSSKLVFLSPLEK